MTRIRRFGQLSTAKQREPVDVSRPCLLLSNRMSRPTCHHVLVVASLLAIAVVQLAAANVLVRCEDASGRVEIELNCNGRPESCDPTARDTNSDAPSVVGIPCIDTTFKPDLIAPNLGGPRGRLVTEAPPLPAFYLAATFDPTSPCRSSVAPAIDCSQFPCGTLSVSHSAVILI